MVFLLLVGNLMSQNRFYTSGKSVYTWDDYNKKYIDERNFEGKNVFWFSHDYEQFHQAGEVQQTFHLVDDGTELEETLIFKMVDIEVMHEYTLVLKIMQDELLIMFDYKGDSYLARYYIVRVENLE